MPSPDPIYPRLSNAVEQMCQCGEGAAVVQLQIALADVLARLPEDEAHARLTDLERQAAWMVGQPTAQRLTRFADMMAALEAIAAMSWTTVEGGCGRAIAMHAIAVAALAKTQLDTEEKVA